MIPLRHLTLGRALADLERVREDEGPNLSAEIRAMFAALDPPIEISDDAEAGYPWCAAAVQWWSDGAANLHGLRNPLDRVRREAYVPDYAAAVEAAGWVVELADADQGCLAIFNFRGRRWDHIGLVADAPRLEDGRVVITTVDGNSNTAGSRDGDRVVRKTRRVRPERLLLARWDEGVGWTPPAP